MSEWENLPFFVGEIRYLFYKRGIFYLTKSCEEQRGAFQARIKLFPILDIFFLLLEWGYPILFRDGESCHPKAPIHFYFSSGRCLAVRRFVYPGETSSP